MTPEITYADLEQYFGGFFFGFLGLLLLVLGGFSLLEAAMLWTRHTPITQFVRNAVKGHFRLSLYVAVIVGIFLGHFWP